MAALVEHASPNITNYASMLQFVGRLQRIPQVQRLGITAGVDLLHLWVLFPTDDEDAMRQAIDAERDFLRAAGPIPMDFHFYALDEIDATSLPEMFTIFERA